jgi:hypothetical protein
VGGGGLSLCVCARVCDRFAEGVYVVQSPTKRECSGGSSNLIIIIITHAGAEMTDNGKHTQKKPEKKEKEQMRSGQHTNKKTR